MDVAGSLARCGGGDCMNYGTTAGAPKRWPPSSGAPSYKTAGVGSLVWSRQRTLAEKKVPSGCACAVIDARRCLVPAPSGPASPLCVRLCQPV